MSSCASINLCAKINVDVEVALPFRSDSISLPCNAKLRSWISIINCANFSHPMPFFMLSSPSPFSSSSINAAKAISRSSIFIFGKPVFSERSPNFVVLSKISSIGRIDVDNKSVIELKV